MLSSKYGNSVCDCGCGVVDDKDCGGSDSSYCKNCYAVGSCSFLEGCSGIDSANNAICDNLIAGWTCPIAYYGDGTCDCGCGITDVKDCADATAASCDSQSCNDPGSCAYGLSDCSTILPTDSGKCTADPQQWTCDPLLQGDGVCDCGCAISDQIPGQVDCSSTDINVCQRCADMGSCATSCANINPTNNTICD